MYIKLDTFHLWHMHLRYINEKNVSIISKKVPLIVKKKGRLTLTSIKEIKFRKKIVKLRA